jgi:Methyltransferase domain
VLPVPACPVCDGTERTIVCEYNRLIFLDSEWQSDLARYDYALCHGCGLVHPTRRPDRQEYEYLYAHFNEFLLREGRPNAFNVPDLSPQLKQDIDREFVHWETLETRKDKGSSIRRRLSRDLAAARANLALITPHVSLAGAKVLHLRAKSATFADYVKQRHGAAQVDVVTLFPAHQYLAEKSPGHRVITSLDYQDFHIPFDEKYDLILEQHVLVHMLDPTQTFAVFRRHLNEGGAIFLKGELSDEALWRKGKNLMSELRPFHFNHFDQATLARMLHRYGFELVAIEGTKGAEFLGLVRLAGPERPSPRISGVELEARLAMYRAWRDESILSLPRARAAALFGTELPAIRERVSGAGRLKLDERSVPLAARPVGELDLPVSALALGSVGRRRRWLSDTLAAGWRRSGLSGRAVRVLRGTRLADWLATVLRGTRAGKWLQYRVVGLDPVREQAL